MFFLSIVCTARAYPDRVTVTSNDVEIQCNGEETVMHFSENAKIEGKSFWLKSDNIDIFLKNDIKSIENNDINSIKKVIGVGHASFENENNFGDADTIHILPKERTMILEGAATVFNDEQGTVHGEKIAVDGATKSIITSGSTHGRSSISVNDIGEFKKMYIEKHDQSNSE